MVDVSVPTVSTKVPVHLKVRLSLLRIATLPYGSMDNRAIDESKSTWSSIQDQFPDNEMTVIVQLDNFTEMSCRAAI